MNIKKIIRKNGYLNISGREYMFLPIIAVLSFLIVGYAGIDKEAPVIITDEVVVEYGDDFLLEKLEITDNRDDRKDLLIEADTSELNIRKIGTYNVPITVHDNATNFAKKIISVKVVDTVSPYFTINDNVIVENNLLKINVNSDNNITNYVSAFDNADGDVTMYINTVKGIDTSVLGQQSAIISVSDASGNYNDLKLNFDISDVEKPVIDMNDRIVVDYGSNFELLQYANIYDNSTSIENLIIDHNAINTNEVGEQLMTLNVTDESGNTTSKEIVIEIKDVSAPVIMVASSTYDIDRGTSFDLKPLVTAIDLLDGDVTNSIEISGSVNTNVVGTYYLTISVTDAANNKAEKSIVVNVNEPYVAPVFSSTGGNGSITSIAYSKVGSPYVFGSTGPTAFDCSGFVQYTLGQAGISISRTSASQYYGGTKVTDIQPGDLLFFNTYSSLSHVGIYIGNNQMIHCGSEYTGVEVTNLGIAYWQSTYAGAVRY